jgi:hypothetical protein
MDNKLKVLTIFSTKAGYSTVYIHTDQFNAIKGAKPAMPFTREEPSEGYSVRSFDFDGVKLYTLYKAGVGNSILVSEKDALECKVASQNSALPFVISEVLVPATR